MAASAYAQHIRTTLPKPVAKLGKEADQRWDERIIELGLLPKGAAGAAEYLRRFGKGISAAKCAALALEGEKRKARLLELLDRSIPSDKVSDELALAGGWLGDSDAALANYAAFIAAFWEKTAELDA